ncbi:hypothetical protein [Streptomyces iranensis]|uniref:hypothetical protein n=1 Tax=Streptomyces iranensis TaxID=576784 RepID=UPI0039B74925
MLRAPAGSREGGGETGEGDWRTRLELSGRADWGLYHRHPWIRSDACRQRAYRARRSRPA